MGLFQTPRASGTGFENPGLGRICALACRPRSTSLDAVSWRCHRIDTSECGPGMTLAVLVVIANCAQAGVQSSAAGVEHECRRVERGQEDPRNRSGGSRPSGWRVARRVHLGRARSTARGALAQDRGDLRTSATNAAVLVSGFMQGGAEGARAALDAYWNSHRRRRASARCSAPRSTG